MTGQFHQPVLLHESIEALKIRPGKIYLDLTVGSGGHTRKILKKGGKVYGLDVDPAAVLRAKKRLEKACPGAFFYLEVGNFAKVSAFAAFWGLRSAAGILMDLGLSSEQLADESRGFSFLSQSPLDMRADPTLAVTAADLLNVLTFKELTKLFNKLGQEPLGFSKKLSGVIVDWRKSQKLATTGQLVDLVSRVKRVQGRIHPATKTFQALRIAVNDELNSLKTALPQAVDLLAPGGRLVVISFHSLEDRLVKNFFKGRSDLKIITKKPVRPDPEEINANPRARSAKLRAGEKL